MMQNVLSSWINKVHSLHFTLINNVITFLKCYWIDPANIVNETWQIENREIKQQQRRQLRERHFKKGSRAASNFITLIPSRLIRKILANFLVVEFWRLYQSSGKETESRCLVFASSTEREIRHFRVVVVQQRRQRNVQKAWCTCKVVVCQSEPVAFLPSSLLKLPNEKRWTLRDGPLQNLWG